MTIDSGAMFFSPLAPIPQVIYKKTHLPCPLPFFFHNANLSVNTTEMIGLYQHNSSAFTDFSRADLSPAVLSTSDSHHPSNVHSEPHIDFEDMCTPKYFVFNSQVR